MPEPAPSFSLVAGPSILRPPPQPRTLGCLPRPPPPPWIPQPPPPQPPHPPPPPRLHPALHPPNRGGNLPKGPPNPSPPRATPPPPRPTPRRGPRPQPGRSPRLPPSSRQNPSARRGRSPQPNLSRGPSPAPRQQREPGPPRTFSMTFSPSHPRPGGSSASTAPPHRHRRHRHHLHGGARRGRSATHIVPPPLKANTPGPRTAPDRARTTPGSASNVSAPLPTLDVSPHTAHAPLPPPPRVPTQPRGRDRARTPASPRPLAPPLPAHLHGTGLRGIPQARQRHQSQRPRHTHPSPLFRSRPRPRPRTVVLALDPHAALGAAKVGPGRALPRGPGPAAPQGVGGELPPLAAGGGVDAAGCMGSHAADALNPLGVHPRNLPAPQDHPYVLRRLRETLQETQRDGNACGTSPKAQPCTHTPPHHPTSVSAPILAAPTAPQEPCAPHSTTRLTPPAAALPPNPVTQQATATGRHTRPHPEVTNEAGPDPRGHLGVTWGVYLCAGKPPLADIILSHPPDLTRCDSVIGLAIPAMSGHIQS